MNRVIELVWKPRFAAVCGLMLLIWTMPQLLSPFASEGINFLCQLCGPGFIAWQQSHALLTHVLTMSVTYVIVYSCVIWILLGFLPRGIYLRTLLRDEFAELRKRFGPILLTAVAGWLLSTWVIALLYGRLPLPQTLGYANALRQEGTAFVALVLYALLATFAGPFFEEVICRGFVYNMLRTSLSNGWLKCLPIAWESAAVIISAALFAAMHGNGHNTTELLIKGIALALVYKQTGNLFGSMIMHFLNNAFVSVLWIGAIWQMAPGG